MPEKDHKKTTKTTTTYVNREHTNVYVIDQVNKKLKEAKAKPIETLTNFHRRMRIAYLCKLITAGDTEPGAAVTFDTTTLMQLDHGKKRVGKPRLNWYQVTMKDLWEETKKHIDTVKFASELNLKNATHKLAIETRAAQNAANTQQSRAYPPEAGYRRRTGFRRAPPAGHAPAYNAYTDLNSLYHQLR